MDIHVNNKKLPVLLFSALPVLLFFGCQSMDERISPLFGEASRFVAIESSPLFGEASRFVGIASSLQTCNTTKNRWVGIKTK